MATSAIEHRQAELDQFYSEVFGAPDKKRPTDKPSLLPVVPLGLDEKELLDHARAARNGAKFCDLFDKGIWQGDTSHSEADLALCGLLAFWFQCDKDRMDRVFRQSRLYRKKWDREDYRNDTLDKAISECKEVYTPKTKPEAGNGECPPVPELDSNTNEFTPEELSKAVYSEQDGDASIYIKLYRDRFRFDHSSGIWLERKEHYYSEDIIGESLAAIDKITGLYEKEAARFFWLQMKAVKEQNTKAEHEAEKDLRAYRRKIGLLQKIQWKQAVLQLAAAGKHSLGLTGNEWDQDPWILPCVNGIVDLKTGNLRPGRKDEYIKTICPHEYKGLGLETPAWKVFMASLFDNAEISAFIQRLFGSALLGVVIEHLLPILTGGGRNGKGTILEALKYALGALAGPVPSELLLRQRDSKNPDAPSASLMALRGKRIVWASETERGRQFIPSCIPISNIVSCP